MKRVVRVHVILLNDQKFNLPEKVSGAFAIDYLPVNSKIKRTISIEAKDNNDYTEHMNSRTRQTMDLYQR